MFTILFIFCKQIHFECIRKAYEVCIKTFSGSVFNAPTNREKISIPPLTNNPEPTNTPVITLSPTITLIPTTSTPPATDDTATSLKEYSFNFESSASPVNAFKYTPTFISLNSLVTNLKNSPFMVQKSVTTDLMHSNSSKLLKISANTNKIKKSTKNNIDNSRIISSPKFQEELIESEEQSNLIQPDNANNNPSLTDNLLETRNLEDISNLKSHIFTEPILLQIKQE